MMDPETIKGLANEAEYLRAQFIAHSRPRKCNVVYDYEAETIHVVTDDVIWTMEIGSDDDCYHFENPNGEILELPLSMATC